MLQNFVIFLLMIKLKIFCHFEHSLDFKLRCLKNENQNTYFKNMTEFLQTMLSIINLLFLKSEIVLCAKLYYYNNMKGKRKKEDFKNT